MVVYRVGDIIVFAAYVAPNSLPIDIRVNVFGASTSLFLYRFRLSGAISLYSSGKFGPYKS